MHCWNWSKILYFDLHSIVSIWIILATDGCELYDYEIHIRTESTGITSINKVKMVGTKKCWKCGECFPSCVGQSDQAIINSTNCKGSDLLAASRWILSSVKTYRSVHYKYKVTENRKVDDDLKLIMRLRSDKNISSSTWTSTGWELSRTVWLL